MKFSWCVCVILALTHYAHCHFTIQLNHNGPAVLGATVTFEVIVQSEDGRKLPPGPYRFKFEDDAIPRHSTTILGEFNRTTWNVTYDRALYSAREYEMEVKVARKTPIFFWDIGSARVALNVTGTLNGRVDLVQNGTSPNLNYVDFKKEVEHRITFSPTDAQHLASNWTSIVAYWFLGCSYFGSTNDLAFRYNYSKEDLNQNRVVRALVVASHVNESLVHQPTNNSVDDRPSSVNPEDFNEANVTREAEWNEDVPCDDFPKVPMDSNKYYGYFKRTVSPLAAVAIDQINGSNWLENGELLSLNLSCSGSSPFYHCVRFLAGIYNVTGNETCSQPRQTQNCKISVTRLLSSGSKYTVLFIISNRISKTVTQFGVTTYSEKYHPQLSVIVVPISCCVFAIVLIIFGIAFYIQSRNRFRIEVADFNFSRNSDTEYMTFRERLCDAIFDCSRDVDDDSDDSDGTWSRTNDCGGDDRPVTESPSSETSPSGVATGGGVVLISSVRSPGKKANGSPSDGLLCDLSDSEYVDA